MGVTGDICRRNTELTQHQIDIIESKCLSLKWAADLAHAQVTVYTKAREAGQLVVIAQLKPNTSFVQRKVNLLGTTVNAVEEPLIWHTLLNGKYIRGQREWALGMCMEMHVYPLYDEDKEIIAVVSFEASLDEAKIDGYNVLVKTAYMLLNAENMTDNMEKYRQLTASDGILIVEGQGKIVFANSTADSIYKVLGVGCVINRYIYDQRLDMRFVKQAMNAREYTETEYTIGNLTLVQRVIPIVKKGLTARAIVIVNDATEIKKKEKELLIKSAVIQEIHHRVKNNLQTIASLLRLQARRTTSAEVKAALRESVNRILSISVVHEFLSQQDAEIIDVAEVANNILDLVIQNMVEPEFNLQTVFNGQTVILPSEKASSLALVINELIQNSIEHGFVGRREGIIGVDVEILPEIYRIEIYDNGIGLPVDFNSENLHSLGLQIVRALIENDLGGTFKLYSDKGTRARIEIPRKVEGGN